MRLDVERPFKLNKQHIDLFHDYFQEIASDISVVVLSDYAKGVVVPAIIRRIIDLARKRRIPVIVDPKNRDVRRYAGASILTPNASEAAAIVGFSCADDERAEKAAQAIAHRAGVEAVILTRGAQGMTVYDLSANPKTTHIATTATDVFDVSGAGDTVVAALSLALSCGASVADAARMANAAAGVAVSKRGTAAVHAQALADALGAPQGGTNSKIVDGAMAKALVTGWQAQGLKVGFTNGCFDLLHPGHVELLKRARATCDKLIVALNTDASVRRLKGETRPIQNQQARSIVMAALDSVDLVTLFDEDTPQALIELLRPDYLVKGSDYTISNVVGADFVTSYGGKVFLVPLESGHSTTRMIDRAAAKA